MGFVLLVVAFILLIITVAHSLSVGTKDCVAQLSSKLVMVSNNCEKGKI